MIGGGLKQLLWHAYADEVGDRGWKRSPAGLPAGKRAGSSEHFSMVAIVVPDGYQSVVLDRWDSVTLDIDRSQGDVIHWRNVKSHGQRLHLVKTLAGFESACVIAVVFSKWDTPNTSADGVQQPEFLYNWVLRLLIERLSWFARDNGGEMVMTFAQVKGLNPEKVRSYVEHLRSCDTTIVWDALRFPVRIDTPANRRMLQVADTLCGAINAAFEWDNYGNVETRYLETLRPRLWCRTQGTLQSYGLKINPFPHPRHPWATEFCRRH